jgi:hypothetical protein
MSQAKKEIRSRSLWPENKVCSTNIVIVGALFDFLYASIMALTPATACQHSPMISLSKNASVHYFIYWGPTFVYLLTILMSFNTLSKTSLIFSLIVGILALFWHVANLGMYVSFKEWSDIPSATHASSTAAM